MIDNTAVLFTFPAAVALDNAFGLQTAANNGMRMPDVILNMRVDQAWGYISGSAALHDLAGAYYLTPNNVNNGHPNDKKGWAVGLGALFNLPAATSSASTASTRKVPPATARRSANSGRSSSPAPAPELASRPTASSAPVARSS